MPASTGAAATGFGTRELQQVVRDAELGRRYADKLAEVYTLDGAETWVLVHIEIQGRADPGFAERMYVYHYRLFDRYRRDVVSLGHTGVGPRQAIEIHRIYLRITGVFRA